jgi:hypothetical protein
MPDASTVPAPRQSYNRCQISNGSSPFLGDVDRRSLQARRHVDLLEDMIADLGGAENCTVAQIEVVRRAAGLGAFCDRCEAAMAREEEVEFDRYLAACNSLRRLLVTLGLERRARDVTTIDQYVAEKRGAA